MQVCLILFPPELYLFFNIGIWRSQADMHLCTPIAVSNFSTFEMHGRKANGTNQLKSSQFWIQGLIVGSGKYFSFYCIWLVCSFYRWYWWRQEVSKGAKKTNLPSRPDKNWMFEHLFKESDVVQKLSQLKLVCSNWKMEGATRRGRVSRSTAEGYIASHRETHDNFDSRLLSSPTEQFEHSSR